MLANACELAEGLGDEGHLAALQEALERALRATALLPLATALQALRAQLVALAAHPVAERLHAVGALLRAPGFNRLALELIDAAQA
jgi:hypothetical protein